MYHCVLLFVADPDNSESHSDVQKSCQEDCGIYTNCLTLLFYKERLTHEFEQTLKNFCCFLELEKQQ